ncbi:MAG: LysR family transcriptional regulator [Oceanospirillaceae bacterium]
MNLNINDMMIFLAVVESGSFTIAAELLGIPKANVSRKVSRLEQVLGVILLERSTRSQHLTEVGRRYLIHCKRIHEELDLAQVTVSETTSSYKGVLKIGVSVAAGQQILKPAIASFLRQYPQIDIQLNLTNERVDLIKEGFDMLIRVGNLDDSQLIAKRLGSAQRKLYASPDYIINNSSPKNIDDLCQHNILMMSMHNYENKLELTSGKNKKIIHISPRLLVNDFSIVKQALIDGEGIAVLPEYMCLEELSSNKLINILPDWGMPSVDLYALYPQHRVKIPKVKVFLDFVVDTFTKKLLFAKQS